MSSYFKKAICLVLLLFVNSSLASTWEEIRNELSTEEQERLDEALVTATADHDAVLIQELIEQGADVNCGDSGEYSDYEYAHFHQKSLLNYISRYLFGGGRSCVYTALMIAAIDGDPNMTQLLLDQGALPNLKVGAGEDSPYPNWTAANFAEARNQIDTLEILLKKGALFGIYYSSSEFPEKKLLNYQEYQEYKSQTLNDYENYYPPQAFTGE